MSENKVTISIRLKKSVAADLAKLAQEQNRNVSNTIETILINYFKTNPNETNKSRTNA